VTTRRIAIIPARGGSKRILKKNIKSFCGKPMLSYALTAARESGLFDVIHVSTDCAEIRAVATALGFSPDFSRPSELADDFTPILPVLAFVLAEYKNRGEVFDQVCMIMPTAPFIEPADLCNAVDEFAKHDGQYSVISVSKYPVPVEWAYSMDDRQVLIPENEGAFAIRSQDLAEKYYDTGMFILFSAAQVVSSEGSGTNKAFVGYKIGRDKAIDIDDLEDWEFAEKLYRGKLAATSSSETT
jgi:pseudaminic acid cytidylyltransferase